MPTAKATTRKNDEDARHAHVDSVPPDHDISSTFPSVDQPRFPTLNSTQNALQPGSVALLHGAAGLLQYGHCAGPTVGGGSPKYCGGLSDSPHPPPPLFLSLPCLHRQLLLRFSLIGEAHEVDRIVQGWWRRFSTPARVLSPGFTILSPTLTPVVPSSTPLRLC